MRTLELKIPPPLIALFIAALMWVSRIITSSIAFDIPWRTAFALALLIVGVTFAIAGMLAFRKANTTVNPTKPETTSTVVATGIYRLTRNPMYFGLLIVLTGWAVFLGHAIPFLFLPLFVLYVNRFQIGPEERVLSEHFGSEYSAYMQSVRRWL